MAPRKMRDLQGWKETTAIGVMDAPPPATPYPSAVPAVLAGVLDTVSADVKPPDALDLEHFKLGPTGLVVKGKPSFDEWSNIGGMLRLFEQGVQWLLGDWVNFGEGEWGDKTAQVIDAERFTESTIRVYAWTAAKVPPKNRIPGLSYSHHQTVAEFTPSEQEKWLTRALKHDWSISDLKREIKAKKLGTGPVMPEVVGEVRLADEADGQEWIRQMTALGREKCVVKVKGATTH